MTKQFKVSVRPDTHKKLKRIAKANRRTIAETADIVVDDYTERLPLTTDAHPAPAGGGDTRSGNSALSAK